MTKAFPKDKTIDSSLHLIRDGYHFLPKKRKKIGADIFETHLLFKKAICLSGKDAAGLFYDPEKFIRKGATPSRIKKSLFGQKGVQGLDGSAHRHRKEMFMSLMSRDNLQQFLIEAEKQWITFIDRWENQDEVVLFTEMPKLLCKAACAWAGVPLEEGEVARRAHNIWLMVDAFGAVGPRHWRGRRARIKAEIWIEEIIEKIRTGEISPPAGTAAHTMAFHRDQSGKLLDVEVAAVELLNIIRPTVAIAVYIAFTAHALHTYPTYAKKLTTADDEEIERFVQEVRRFYPFVPLLGAIVRDSFEWQGFRFEKDTRVLLDVYGILHDSKLWQSPDKFNPERFKNWEGDPFRLIPQGGGDHHVNHRCAGEWLTLEAMKQAVHFLVKRMTFHVKEDQDLSFSLSRMPTYPRDGFIIAHVKKDNEVESVISTQTTNIRHM